MRTRPRRGSPRSGGRAGWGVPLLVAGAVAATASCGDGSPTSTEVVRLEVVSGDQQRGLAGETLLEPVEVRLLADGDAPLPGRRVEFTVRAGGGSVDPAYETTDEAGRAHTRWTLGGPPGTAQRLEAAPVDVPDEAVVVEATVVEPGQTDVVVLRGASGPMKGVLLVRGDPPGGPEAGLVRVQDRAWADTLVPIQPMDGGTTEVVAFPWTNAPQRTTVEWTPALDTAYVDLRPPVPLSLRITVAEGPFEERMRIVEQHLSTFRGILEKQGVGATVADVRIVDRTEEMAGTDVGAGACSFPRGPADRIHVYYVAAVNGSSPAGVACPPGLAFVAADPGQSPNLLAHELGHLLGLPHVLQGLMNAFQPGTMLTEGEIFQAHFHTASAINAVFEVHPPALLRDCGPPHRARCLPLDYELR